MKEADIRPQALFDEYLALARRDVDTFFGAVPRDRVPCPACGGEAAVPAFEKHGFAYEICDACATLFVNPRPPAEAFGRYYAEAPSTRFWATRFYRETEAARRREIFEPRARRVLDTARRLQREEGLWIADIGAGYGMFCDEVVRQADPGTPVVAIEPGAELAAVCAEKGHRVVRKFLEEVEAVDLPPADGRTRVFTSFELFEHLHDPRDFLLRVRRLLDPGDLFILTTLSGTGFDIQVLWEDSKSVHPPHHLNFLNPAAMALCLDRAGFETVEVTTPGKLDVDIAANLVDRVKDRFARTLLETGSPGTLAAFQDFLQVHGLSSHMMAVARRP